LAKIVAYNLTTVIHECSKVGSTQTFYIWANQEGIMDEHLKENRDIFW